MKRRSRAGGEPVKTRRRKAMTPKRGIAPPKTVRRRSPAAGQETKVAWLTRERNEALEQQTATSALLSVISRSNFDLHAVLQSVIDTAARLCRAEKSVIYRLEQGVYRFAAAHGVGPAYLEIERTTPFLPGPGTLVGRVAMSRQVVRIDDVLIDPLYEKKGDARIGGFRSAMGVPLLRDNEPIGVLGLSRSRVEPFSEREIELTTTFADQAVIAMENVRLFEAEQERTRELSASLEQQTATAEVLSVISSSPGDLQPVFEAMLENAVRICGAKFGNIYRWDGEALHLLAAHNTPPALMDVRKNAPLRPKGNMLFQKMVEAKTAVQFGDIAQTPGYLDRTDAAAITVVEVAGARTAMLVPMMKEDKLIGAFTLFRGEVQPFTDKQIELVKNFAAQAVIAIENARLLNELRQRTTDLTEALEQQTATSNVLQVISSSPGNLEPVFATMLENAVRLCDGKFGSINRWDGEALHLVATHNVPSAFAEFRSRTPFRPGPENPISRMLMTKTVIHFHDLAAEQGYIERNPTFVAAVELGGVRTFLAVPMLKENELIGVVIVYRQEVRPFSDKQVEIVKNFAAQPVIAIENARLLAELRKRTDELETSLEYQTATSDVLKVISRSVFDLQKILEFVAETAARLCAAKQVGIFLLENHVYRFTIGFGLTPAYREIEEGLALEPGPETLVGRVALEGETVHILDALSDPHYGPKDDIRAAKVRTILGVPLTREGKVVGVIALARETVSSFSSEQIELVRTFADQAVIAIENARLLNELRESLQQQTATADVLRVISSSPTNIQPVLDAILKTAGELCASEYALFFRLQDGKFHVAGSNNAEGKYVKYLAEKPIDLDRGSLVGRTALERRPVHIPDCLADPEYTSHDYARVGKHRSMLGVPLLRDGLPIGVIGLLRTSVQPYTEKQIELVTTFADQAVIAIENARLLTELRQSLHQQTATADVLKVISRSTFDLQTVLQTLVESAARLCEADKATITRQKGKLFYRTESYGFSPEFMEYVRDVPVEPERGSALGRALLEGHMVHIHDVRADPEYTFVEAQRLGDFRTVLGVPMLREGVPIGVLALTRAEVRPFTDRQIELVSTFADQAAIAIENVRSFESAEARTRELAKSLEDLRTTQDRLVQTEKLASLGQLTAGIAHEIKNPLNFVNNFSAVSVELVDELREALGGVHLDSKLRAEITEIADTLQGNLDKVVQHGKRADAIVKNMLLHSRQGSGEHRPVDINALVDESLNLAYHGARAEKQGFTITLERSFDPAAGEVDLFPQEITRALLNLISNGFYAATKRKAEANRGDYEPTLAATTKSLGDGVEIRIRDNGTGIPPEVREKLFNPFFTTKPAGEGTGLGLSISHDIIVKQHGGSIEVDTKPGEFTEFRIVLPRSSGVRE